MRAIQLKFLFYHQNCRNHSLGRFVGVRMGGHIAETNLRCGRSSGIYTPNLNSLALIVSEISAFIRTDRQTDRRTRLVILIKNMYTLWDRKRFLLPVIVSEISAFIRTDRQTLRSLDCQHELSKTPVGPSGTEQGTGGCVTKGVILECVMQNYIWCRQCILPHPSFVLLSCFQSQPSFWSAPVPHCENRETE